MGHPSDYVFIFYLPFLNISASENIRTVVVVFALNPNLPAYQQFTTGFKSSLNANKEIRSNVILEYCDIYRFGNNENIETLVKLYNEKYRTAKIDLLITVGPGLHPIYETFNPCGILKTKADGKRGQIIENLGPLTKKRMETIEEETVTAKKH